MIQVVLGILYANFLEWFIHRYLLHGVGKNKKSFWSFHFHDHHKKVIQGNGLDPTYEEEGFYTREIIGLVALLLAHIGFWWLSPIFFYTLVGYLVIYYCVHTKSHKDIKWSQKYVPWHYDHHMKYQNANWGVVLPWTDILLGTRRVYYQTDEFFKDELKRIKH